MAATAFLVGALGGWSTGPAQATPTPTVSSAPAAAAAASPVLSLPTGPVPTGVAYGIGKSVYLNGHRYDFAPYWATLRGQPGAAEFNDVAITRGVIIWSIRLDAVDPLSSLGRFVPGQVPRRFTKVASFPGLATTTGGLVASGLNATFAGTVPIYTNAGKLYPPGYTSKYSFPGVVESSSAGGQFVMADFNPSTGGYTSSRLYPGYTAVALPDNTFGAGGGSGWVATAAGNGSTCYRIAPLAQPTARGAVICSQRLPLVSDDGTKAVVLQGRHVRLYDTRTGQQLNATNAPTLGAWDATHGYSLERWLDSTTYLVNVRDGSTLALLRCSATTRACQRAVTSAVRTGVTQIVS